MDTRWLDDDEKVMWRLWIATSRLVEDALDRQLRDDADMPHSYYELLVRLSSRPDRRMRMSELAALTLSSRSRLSHAVGKLEELGWVRREDCAEDRRGQVAVLTDAGFQALDEAAPGHVEAVRTLLFDPLDAGQQTAMADACRDILAALGEDPAQITHAPD